MKKTLLGITLIAAAALILYAAEPKIGSTTVVNSPSSKATGDMIYWNGSTFVSLALGSQGQPLGVGTNRVYYLPVTIDGSGNVYVGSLTSTNEVTGSRFRGTGATADSNLELPDDDASHKLTIQANNTTTTDVNVIWSAAPGTGFVFTTIGSTTNDTVSKISSTGTGTVVLNTAPTISTPIVDVASSLSTDDTYSGVTRSGRNNSGGVTQWDTVYLNSSSQWVLADANGSGTYPCRGLATATATTGNATTVITRGTVRNDAWNWTVGGTIYLSVTAGGLTQTAPSTTGDKIQVIGYALDADTMAVEISPDYGTAP